MTRALNLTLWLATPAAIFASPLIAEAQTPRALGHWEGSVNSQLGSLRCRSTSGLMAQANRSQR